VKWHPNLTIPHEVLFNEKLTTLDKYIIGVVYTFPEIKVEEIHQFLPDYHLQEISSKLEDLNHFGCLEKDRSTTFKIKNLLNLTYKSQKNQTIQDQESSAPAPKRIIRRQKNNPENDLGYYYVSNSTNKRSITRSSLEDRGYEPEKKYIPTSVQEFLDVWFNHDLYIQGDATKGFAQDIESLKGLITGRFYEEKNVPFQYMGRKFSLEEWTLAVERFHRMAYDLDYLPVKKEKLRKMHLRNFLYNEFHGYEGDRLNSLFLRCLQEEPRTKRRQRKEFTEEDSHPKITARLIHLFSEFKEAQAFNVTDVFFLPRQLHDLLIFVVPAYC